MGKREEGWGEGEKNGGNEEEMEEGRMEGSREKEGGEVGWKKLIFWWKEFKRFKRFKGYN